MSKKTVSEKYSKQVILAQLPTEREILAVLLEDEKQYSFEEVKAIVEEWREGSVK